RLSDRRAGAHSGAHLPGRPRALGGAAQQLPRGGAAAPAPGHLGSLADAPRGGAAGLAAAPAGARPRAQQLARPHPLDGRDPPPPPGPRAAPGRLAGRPAPGAPGGPATGGGGSPLSGPPTPTPPPPPPPPGG